MRRVFIVIAGVLGPVVLTSACTTATSPISRGSGTTSTSAGQERSTTSTTTVAGSSTSTTTTAPRGSAASVPTLGVASAWGSSAVGFGQSRPAEISLGGDPTGILTGITWQSWGGATATGSGTSTYVGPNQTVAQGTQETATVVASDLGACGGGRPAYQQVKWYFPMQGETRATGANSTINACTGP